jgi:hypothetical protein
MNGQVEKLNNLYELGPTKVVYSNWWLHVCERGHVWRTSYPANSMEGMHSINSQSLDEVVCEALTLRRALAVKAIADTFPRGK